MESLYIRDFLLSSISATRKLLCGGPPTKSTVPFFSINYVASNHPSQVFVTYLTYGYRLRHLF